MDDAILIEIQHLCKMINERGLRAISLSRPDLSVAIIASPSTAKPIAQAISYVTPSPSPSAARPAIEPEAAVRNEYAITSPLIGIFYRASSPDAPNFVDIGDTVEVGQTIGIVEAMKVFNEIVSEVAGTVIAIPAEKGMLVQVDEPLVIIEPSA